MRENHNQLRRVALYVPLVVACIAMVYLGTVFVQGYDSGNALPHVGGTTRFVGLTPQEPEVESVEIVDTSRLPDNMPAVPTPARQTVTHTMQHREQPRPQPARPLQPVAEAATSAQAPVKEAVHEAIDVMQDLPKPNPILPVPEIPEPQIPPIVE